MCVCERERERERERELGRERDGIVTGRFREFSVFNALNPINLH